MSGFEVRFWSNAEIILHKSYASFSPSPLMGEGRDGGENQGRRPTYPLPPTSSHQGRGSLKILG